MNSIELAALVVLEQPEAKGKAPEGFGSVEQVAERLFSGHLLPFELTSLLLLVAVVGAVVLARRRS